MRHVLLLHVCIDNVELPADLLLLGVELREDDTNLIDREREDATRNQHHERANHVLALIARGYITIT